MTITTPIVLAMAMLATPGCDASWGKADVARRRLPEPQIGADPPLSTVLATRRSKRAFGRRALSDTELGQLLWAAQGITDGHRTVPSAGALYPLTIRVVDAGGVWRYEPAGHEMIRELANDRRADVANAALGQSAVRSAPAIVVISGEVAITAKKYGSRAAERFVTLEAGHAAQNVLLAATALGLGAVPVGAFDSGALHRVLGLPADVTPLYLIPVGATP